MKTVLSAVLTIFLLTGMLFAQTDENQLGNELTLTEKTKISERTIQRIEIMKQINLFIGGLIRFRNHKCMKIL